MTGISKISGTVQPYRHDNVDTDQILPKQFLTRVTKAGYGKYLFNDLRYINGKTGNDNPEFELNNPQYQGANILLAGDNFGCGSSREHAPWAIADYGFEAVIAPSFADIFYNNCINNQILPVALKDDEVKELFDLVTADPGTQIHIDLPQQVVEAAGQTYHFAIAENHKHNLLKGQDKIDAVLDIADKIRAYKSQVPAWRI